MKRGLARQAVMALEYRPGHLHGLVMGVCLPVLRSGLGVSGHRQLPLRCGHTGVSLRGAHLRAEGRPR